jgi:hypothetical protein
VKRPRVKATSAAVDPVIDVMVLYDKGVADRGGVDAFIAALIEQSNQSYRISAIPQTLRLVHSRQVNSGLIGNHNSWIRTNADVARWREQYGADLVAMIVESGFDPCGIAVTGGHASTVRRSCALGDRSFTHELGHNMGAKHAREQYTTHSGFAYGYINHQKSWRTVMSYSECNQGGPCTRLGYFSNPDVLHDGDPTGIPDLRDNARMVRQYSQTISGYMPTRVGNPTGAPRQRVLAQAPDGFVIRGIGKGTLSLRLTRAERLEISMRDLKDRYIILADGKFQPGDHTLAWRRGEIPAGVHFIRIRGSDRTVFRKIPVMN